jgi:superfamily I DNA/RNA helicase
MTHTPTPEQQAIIDAAVNTEDNLIVAALAGAAKTSTLVMLAEALPRVAILCLAFNKKIATEMQERLPSNCVAMTLNSLGHRTWGATIGKRLIIEDRKLYNLLKSAVEKLGKVEQDEAWETFADTLNMAKAGKTAGYVPTGHYTQIAKPLMNDSEFFACLDEAPTAQQERLIKTVTVESIRQAFNGSMDFDDQIFMPTNFPSNFVQYPLVLVDEAQDLSALNHVMLKKLAKKRLIAVGDECQAIYGFRGAHQDSMNLLQQTFNMRKLILSVSFRCPISIVEEARWRAPHMRWPDWAKPGLITDMRGKLWQTETLPDDAVIICRNNSPIFSMAIKLLQNGRYPKIIGNDIGAGLLKNIKKFGPTSMPSADLMEAINTWEQFKLSKSRSPAKVSDQAECMRVFARQGESLGDAVAYAEHIFNSSGPIQMMTAHKSKGLEFDNIFILDRHLIRVEKEQQEANLLYVAQTRSKSTLTYIESDFFESNQVEEAA